MPKPYTTVRKFVEFYWYATHLAMNNPATFIFETSLLSTLIPHKENDKGIVEETSDQIKSISGLRDELANLEKQRGSMSTDKYLKAEQKIPSNFIFQFS